MKSKPLATQNTRPAHWAIMTAAARRLVTTSAASNASVARVPAVPQSRRAPIRRTSCKPGRPKGPPTQTGRLPFSSTLGGRRARSSCDRIGRCRRPLVAVRRKMRGLRGPLAGVSRFRPGSAISSQAATVLGACKRDERASGTAPHVVARRVGEHALGENAEGVPNK